MRQNITNIESVMNYLSNITHIKWQSWDLDSTEVCAITNTSDTLQILSNNDINYLPSSVGPNCLIIVKVSDVMSKIRDNKINTILNIE